MGYIMEGFLKMNIGIRMRAVLTRIVTIIPCVAVAVAFPSGTALNMFVNWVNTGLSILLPFALFPLAKYNCTPSLMGEEHPGGKGLSHHHSGRPPNPVRVVAFLEPFLGIQGGGSQQSH